MVYVTGPTANIRVSAPYGLSSYVAGQDDFTPTTILLLDNVYVTSGSPINSYIGTSNFDPAIGTEALLAGVVSFNISYVGLNPGNWTVLVRYRVNNVYPRVLFSDPVNFTVVAVGGGGGGTGGPPPIVIIGGGGGGGGGDGGGNGCFNSLYWTASAGAATYTIQRSSSFAGAYNTIASGLVASSFTDNTTSADNGITYYYQVVAVNSSGQSSPSTPIAIVSSCPLLPPSTPIIGGGGGGTPVTGGGGGSTGGGGTAGNGSGSTGVGSSGDGLGVGCFNNIYWAAVSLAITYTVQRSVYQLAGYINIAQGLTSNYYVDNTDPSLDGVTFYYKVAAIGAFGATSSAPFSIVTSCPLVNNSCDCVSFAPLNTSIDSAIALAQPCDTYKNLTTNC